MDPAVVLGAVAGLITAATPLTIALIRERRRDERRHAGIDRRLRLLEQRPCTERDAAIDAELARLRDDIQRIHRRPSFTNE